MVEFFVPGIGRDLRDGLSIGIGFALLSYLVMFTGFFAGFHNTLIWVAFVPFLITLPWTIIRLRKIPARLKGITDGLNHPGDVALWVPLGILFLFDLINGGNAAVGWDAAVHHYAVPRWYLGSEWLNPDIRSAFGFYPQLAEMHFTLALGTGGEFLAGAMSWIYLIPMSLAFLSIGKSLGDRRIGLWAILLFLGAPLTFELPFSGVIDLQFLTYCLLALAVLLDSSTEMRYKKYVLMGILIGCASATKHLGLLYLPAFLVILIWKLISERKKPGECFFAAILVIFYTFLVPLPWYIISYNFTRDPFFPYITNLIISNREIAGSLSVEAFSRTEYPRTIFGFLWYLWHLTMDYWDIRPWYLAINPAWLAFLPPAIILAFKPKIIKNVQVLLNLRLILILAILAMAVNFFLAPAFPRYMFPTWFSLAIVSAYTLIFIRMQWPVIGKIMAPVVLMLPFLVILAMAGKRAAEVAPQYFSEEARINAISDSFSSYEAIQWVNDNLDHEYRAPPTDILLTTDPKIYYIEPYCLVTKSGIESPGSIPWSSDPSEILDDWKSARASYFLLDTTLDSVNGGFALLVISSILGDRNSAWIDAPRTIEAGNEFGLGGFFTEEKLVEFGHYAGLHVVEDGTPGGLHLFTQERMLELQSRGLDYMMAEKIIKFIDAGILIEEFSSGPGWGVVVYSVHIPEDVDVELMELPDVTEWGTDYRAGPVDMVGE